MVGMFELFNDEDAGFRFRITAPDGTVVAVSRSFPDKPSAVAGIRDVREYAGMGHITDLCPTTPANTVTGTGSSSKNMTGPPPAVPTHGSSPGPALPAPPQPHKWTPAARHPPRCHPEVLRQGSASNQLDEKLPGSRPEWATSGPVPEDSVAAGALGRGVSE